MRVEVGFRIVPAGQKSIMRMDLKSVVIINDDIVSVRCYSSHPMNVMLTALLEHGVRRGRS